MTERRTTPRGAATRGRIVDAAAELFHERGVDATGLTDVLVAGNAGKSQLYQHFGGKHELVEAVIDTQAGRILRWHTSLLTGAESIADLRAWADAVVEGVAQAHGGHGCPLGSLSAQVSDRSEAQRARVVAGFTHWEAAIGAAVERVTDGRPSRTGRDAAASAAVLLTALQGGLLLANATHDVRHLRLGLAAALDDLAPPARAQRTGRAPRR